MSGQQDVKLAAFALGILQAYHGEVRPEIALTVRVKDATAELFKRHPETRDHLAAMTDSERCYTCFQLAIQFLPQVEKLSPGEPFIFEM